MASLNVRDLGDFIREQRHSAQISLRQLARQAGVSNPYLSQIERGLRKPSAEILQQIAKALRISAEVLYVQAGFLDEREGDGDVVGAVLRDPTLTERQRQVILDIYESFRGENSAAAVEPPLSAAAPPDGSPTPKKTGAARKATTAPKPATDKPATDKPATTKPAAGKPAAGKPAAGKPDAAKPSAATSSGTGRAAATRAGARPGTTRKAGQA